MIARTIRAALLVLAIHLVTLGGVAAQSGPDAVSLRFGWEDGTTARVEREWSRTRSAGGMTDSVRVISNYTLEVLEHAEGHLVRAYDFSEPRLFGSGSPNELTEQVFGGIATLSPSFVVSPSGEFLRVEDIDALKAAVDSMLLPLFAEIGDLPQATEMMRTLLSEESLTASAAQEWDVVVGAWQGSDWEIGEVYGYEAEEPSPVLPGMMVPMIYEFSATERVPCTPGGAPDECVRLRMLSTPDSDAITALIEGFMQQVVGDQAVEIASMLETMVVENELHVIAEPNTLRPHEVELVTYVEVAGRAPSGVPAGSAVQQDRQVYRYTYE